MGAEVTPNFVISLIGLIVALIVNALAIFRYVAGMRDTLTEKIYAEAAKADAKIDAFSRESRLIVEKAAESESKSRQEFSNVVTNALADMRRDAKVLEDKINMVQHEMIRRSDLGELRQEMMAAIDRQERAQSTSLEKMEKRFETLLANPPR